MTLTPNVGKTDPALKARFECGVGSELFWLSLQLCRL
jgi:hypothetical protein